MAAKKPSSKGQAWFCATGLPSDISIEVDDMTFHLHKFPLMSKSRKLHELITEQETNPNTKKPQPVSESEQISSQTEAEEDEDDEIQEIHCHISLQDFPGGSNTFEMAAKFCYGVKIDLSSSTVVPLRCAGEFLEMTEEYNEENLISKTERFFAQSVMKNLKELVRALKSCELVMSNAESSGLIQRCIDAISSNAGSADPALFSWPVETRRTSNANANSWFDDLVMLGLPLFKRLIIAMKEKDLNHETLENCLVHYAKRYIPGISRSTRKPSSSTSKTSESDQLELLDTIVSNLPLEKSSGSGFATRFLFGLLRTANILNASDSCRSALEKKLGSQLDQATLDDLLIPSYSYLNETLYDVDCVERILGYFLSDLEERNVDGIEGEGSPVVMMVGKLIDGYLAEIASDANLNPDKFYNLAISIPEDGRLFDDGLYRAIDVYLKAHSLLSEAERDKICSLMNCEKLTLEACTHAAQNERLPLRAVVQVLFFEQLQLRQAIAGTITAIEGGGVLPPDLARPSATIQELDAQEAEPSDRNQVSTWRSSMVQNQVLQLDMDNMRTRVHELERECSNMKKVIGKIDRVGPRGWREKFGCKFRTQVCDSQESTVVSQRKDRHRRHHQD